MAHRTERIEKIIERELSSILLFSSNNQLFKYVTITKVALTDDLSIATVWYTVRGTEEEVKATANAINEAKGYLRSEIAKKLDTKKTPELRFKNDESAEYAEKIEKIISSFNKE